MGSLIPGYEYDIFISYRQKDNKYDGWVTEFVDNLKRELESVFKEDITVYFDINPHDGLLETHDVDASLKEKLKCLVFIPIISRTYCDPKSFAWEHEFKAFVEQAGSDKFGMMVRLPGGNVASRVLPVRIHDLDNADIKLCESILGGVMRGVEFIYKEPGVNRSLTPADDDKKNLNNTRYRNQINKVALAAREILMGLQTSSDVTEKEISRQRISYGEVFKEKKQADNEKPARLKRIKLASGVMLTVALIIAALIAYPKIFSPDKQARLKSSDGRISVAVMPFQNMTNDTTIWNIWQDGIQNELINKLTNNEELKVRQSESITGLLKSEGLKNYASLTPSLAGTISKKLEASVFITGSIKQAGNTIRVNAQLIDSKTEEIFRSFQIEGPAREEMIFNITDSLSVMVRNFLVLSKLKEKISPDESPSESVKSPEAYRRFFAATRDKNVDSKTRIKLLSEALAIDSNFVQPYIEISMAYLNNGFLEDAKKWCLMAYAKRDQFSPKDKAFVNWQYGRLFETPQEEVKYLLEYLTFDDQVPVAYWQLGNAYNQLSQYDKAIPAFEMALEIYKKWKMKPMLALNYYTLGGVYQKTGQYRKAKKLYRKAEKDFPDNPQSNFAQATLLLTEGDHVDAKQYIDKHITYVKDNLLFSEAQVLLEMAYIYSSAGILDEAEEYYRQALSLEPESSIILHNLARFLIVNDRNINEAFELLDRSQKFSPDNAVCLACKGWGLYKQGKYEEALKILEKRWEMHYFGDYEVYLHIQEVKKAIANQK